MFSVPLQAGPAPPLRPAAVARLAAPAQAPASSSSNTAAAAAATMQRQHSSRHRCNSHKHSEKLLMKVLKTHSAASESQLHVTRSSAPAPLQPHTQQAALTQPRNKPRVTSWTDSPAGIRTLKLQQHPPAPSVLPAPHLVNPSQQKARWPH
jgi:hypothetical protein